MGVPQEVRARSALASPDYVDRFVLATPRWEAGAERWARTMFGDRPDRAARFIWQVLLGLRLRDETSPELIAGWEVTARGDGWVRMATGSRSMSVELVVAAEGGEASLTTFVRYDRVAGGWRWRPLSAVHRRLSPGLLRRADGRVGE